MTTTVPINLLFVDKPSAGEVAAAVLSWRRAQAVATTDHQDGRHVGFDSDDVACGACMSSGDMPDRPTMTRAQYLERNIEETALLMRMRASISLLEAA